MVIKIYHHFYSWSAPKIINFFFLYFQGTQNIKERKDYPRKKKGRYAWFFINIAYIGWQIKRTRVLGFCIPEKKRDDDSKERIHTHSRERGRMRVTFKQLRALRICFSSPLFTRSTQTATNFSRKIFFLDKSVASSRIYVRRARVLHLYFFPFFSLIFFFVGEFSVRLLSKYSW